MKLILFFLLGVIFSVRAMEREQALQQFSTPVNSELHSFSLTDFSDEIKIKFLEYTSYDDSVEKGIKNAYSLASTCRDFLRLFGDSSFVKNLVFSIESRRQNVPCIFQKKDAHYNRCLKALAMKLKTKVAIQWYYNQVGNKGTFCDFKRILSFERMDFRTIMKHYYGGVDVSEHRIIDARPVKVLDIPEHPLQQSKERAPLKVLSLKSCYLNDLAGLLYVQDLRTVQSFDISTNELTHLTPAALDRFENLTILNISYNNLQSISFDLFFKLKKLKLLDLSHNQIKIILCDLSEDLPEFDKIDLTFNKLARIEPDVLDRISVGIMDLRDNPIANIEELKTVAKPVNKRILVDE